VTAIIAGTSVFTVGHDFLLGGEWFLIVLVMLGAVPEVAASWQFLLVAGHFWRNDYDVCAPVFPRTAVLIPAWNEAAVIGASIDRLMSLEYPRDALRVYLVDDASTDETPQVAAAKEVQYPGSVIHLRREKGGQGKAHTLNHGLAVILGDEWMEALLITDADVIFQADSLRKMTRHLADPRVGAVTAYIKEGSRPGNYMTRFIGYEYITAQAAARRGQNVLGATACLAGGAQLHTRANLLALGGRIDTTSLAEDTFTTFQTQLNGRRVVFEPHAIVWAEEPGSIIGLWKQRLRWARGNVQVTKRYRKLWFRPRRVLRQLRRRVARLSHPVDHQRRHLFLHYRLRAADRSADRSAYLAPGHDVPWRGEPGHRHLHLRPPAVSRPGPRGLRRESFFS
jgi:cellulose synthase/poly-beta-1,6-N-acetylglucosamine synthase-like glycosyltransferase